MGHVAIAQTLPVGASIMIAAAVALGHRIHQELLVKELMLEDFVETAR